MTLRSFIFWPHLIAGVLAGIVILMMSVTGVLLTYERQMIAWSDSHHRSVVPSTGASRLQPEEFLVAWHSANPELAPTAVTYNSAPDAPVVVAVPQRTLYADAYTGRLLGESSQGMRRFMSETRAWHRWFAVEGEGRPFWRAITGWSNLLFAFIVLSGMYLWLPKTWWFPRTWGWKQVKAVTLFKGGLSGKARDFNWHNVIGIWSAIPLFIVVVSAVPISFPWANALVYRAVGEEVPNQGGGGAARGRGGREGAAEREAPSPGGLNALMARAESHVPGWHTINLRVPTAPDAPVVFAIDRGDGGQPHLRSTLTLSPRSGDIVRYESFSELTLGRRIRNTMRFAHTGEVLGIPGQTVAGLVSAGGAVLVWTGIALAWRRFRAWTKRRTRDSVAAEQAETARTTAA
jgi:uncharacterized iron-regulated membrane protein